MNVNDIEKLIKALDDSSLTSLSIKDKVGSLELAKTTNDVVQVVPNQPSSTVASVPVAQVEQTEPKGNFIKSPIVGIVYKKPKPDADDFVKIGQEVKAGQTVCVIEAMKMFNEVKASADGVITEILFEDAQLVEFDTPLFKVG